MDIVSLLVGIVLGVLLGWIFFLIIKNRNQLLHQNLLNENLSLKENNLELSRQIESKEQEIKSWMQKSKDYETRHELSLQAIEELRIQIENETNKSEALFGEKMQLSARISVLTEQQEKQKAEMDALHEKAKLEFEHIAQKLLEEKSSKFTQLNQNNIATILKPLSENIHAFKKQVEETYDRESKVRYSLEERIKELMLQTNRISSEATNLANALKGNHKKQGDWGEMILESILQQSGLVKDREYRVQQNLKSDNQDNLRPDIIVDLPNRRSIVIDSKVSLVAYDHYCSVESPEEQQIALHQHIRAIRTHVDQLSSKNYHQLVDGLDFTMLFVPIEPAYLVAIQNDSKLWSDAYQKRILLISPTNLIACLKLIVDLWNRDKQDKSALKIVSQSEKLYDKLVNFVESFDKVGRQLQNAQDSYQTAVNQMKMGRGNLMSQAQQLLQYGINPKKRLSEDFEQSPEIDGEE